MNGRGTSLACLTRTPAHRDPLVKIACWLVTGADIDELWAGRQCRPMGAECGGRYWATVTPGTLIGAPHGYGVFIGVEPVLEAADMVKAVAPGEIEIPHIGTFVANALPDP